MRRENKIGLVVACAFVALTAVVVYVKMNQGSVIDDTPPNNQQAKSLAKGQELASPFLRTTSGEFVGPIIERAPNTLSVTNGSDLMPPGIVSIGTLPAVTTQPPGLETPTPPHAIEPPKNTVPLEPFPVSQLPGHPDSGPPAISPPGAPGELPNPFASKAAEVNVGELPPAVTAPPAPIAANQNLADSKIPGLPEQPPAVVPTITLTQAPNETKSPQSPVMPTPNSTSPTVVGPAPAVSSPTIPVPVSPNQQRSSGGVEVHDEQLLACLPTDSTFADISRRVYQSDKYARALELYNRSHPQAKDEVRQNPPRLRSGLIVYVPPTAVLERRYPNEIGSTAGQVSPVSPTVVPLQPSAKPVVTSPNSTMPPPNSGVAPVNLTTSADGTKLYRVAGNGEMFYDVARRTLGNGDEWIRIYQLNPQVQPQFAIPAGSLLRLPANARVTQ